MAYPDERWRTRHNNVNAPTRAQEKSHGARPPDFGDRMRRMIRITIRPAAYAVIAGDMLAPQICPLAMRQGSHNMPRRASLQ
jgi:hypothetical protein